MFETPSKKFELDKGVFGRFGVFLGKSNMVDLLYFGLVQRVFGLFRRFGLFLDPLQKVYMGLASLGLFYNGFGIF